MKKLACISITEDRLGASTSFSRWRTDNTYQYDTFGAWSYLPCVMFVFVEANHRPFTKSSLIQIGG